MRLMEPGKSEDQMINHLEVINAMFSWSWVERNVGYDLVAFVWRTGSRVGEMHNVTM